MSTAVDVLDGALVLLNGAGGFAIHLYNNFIALLSPATRIAGGYRDLPLVLEGLLIFWRNDLRCRCGKGGGGECEEGEKH